MIGSVMSYMAIMNSMFSAGVTRFYCKAFAENNIDSMENVLAVSRRIYTVITLIAVAAGFILSHAFQLVYSTSLSTEQLIEGAAMILVLTANLIVTMNNTINVAVINAHERFIFLKVTQLATVLCQPIAVLLAISVYPHAISVCIIQLSLNIICAVSQRLFARKVLKAKVRRHKGNTGIMKQLLLFSSGILLALIADQVFWKTNQLILGYFGGAALVAVYAIANQVASAYISLGTAISSVFLPKTMSLMTCSDSNRQLSNLFIRVGRLASYPLLLGLLSFIVLGQQFISLWAGNSFSSAYFIAIGLMVPATIDSMQNIGLVILQATNRYGFRGAVYGAMAIVNITLVALVVPRYGAIGAACVSGACMLIGNGLVMNLYYKRIGLNILEFWRSEARLVIPLLMFGFGAYVVKQFFGMVELSWYMFALQASIFIGLYLIIAYRFSMNEYERSLLKSTLRKMPSKFRRSRKWEEK